jgi:hypothetical protein
MRVGRVQKEPGRSGTHLLSKLENPSKGQIKDVSQRTERKLKDIEQKGKAVDTSFLMGMRLDRLN